jgi:hypothetical protein
MFPPHIHNVSIVLKDSVLSFSSSWKLVGSEGRKWIEGQTRA